MKIRLMLVMSLGCLSAAAAVEIAADRPSALYACGEKAVFTVKVTDDTGALLPTGCVSVVLDNFGTQQQLQRTADLASGNPFTVEGTLAEPGFLRLVLKGTGVEGTFSWSVGYEPHRIRPVTPVPPDFDAFWASARKRLADEVPLDPQMTRVAERSTAAYDFYRISFATFGRRIHGYMSVPTDAARKPYPVSMEVAAAGFGSWTNDMKPLPDCICVFFGVYPIALDWEWKAHGLKAKFDAFSKGLARRYGCKDYASSGVGSSREECFYYPVILGIDRAIDWIAARSDVDRTQFAYHGTSQGGGMGLILTGLNKHIRRAALFVPAMTDTLAGLAGRQSGWPMPVEVQTSDVAKEKTKTVMPYFDAASFATRITCPVRFAVGFADVTCPPHCTWAAFNAVASSDKKLYYGLGMGHNCRKEFYTSLETWAHGDEDVRLLPGMRASSEGLSLAECARWFEDCGAVLAKGARRHMTNGTNIAVYAPQKGGWYDATWLRDYVMMLEGRLIPVQDMGPIAELFLSKVGANGDGFDCVRYSGEVMWKPGYDTCGENPVLDGYTYITSLIYETWRQTGDDRWIAPEVLAKLRLNLGAMPHDGHYKLPWIDPALEYDRCPFGFTDSVKKTGCVLFCSLLEVRARREFSEMLAAAGRLEESARELAEADRLAATINRVFWDEAHGLYRAATVKCRQHDIWASAYAVWLGVAGGERADRIAAYFKAAYGGLVQNGQIRHLRPGEFWEDYNRHGLPGTYQNGFYWGTATGWFCWTLERIDPALVDKTYNDIVADYKRRGPFERTFNGAAFCPDYLASAAMPLQGLRRLIRKRADAQ